MLPTLTAGFTPSDIKATVAAIAYVVTNATRYRVDAEALNAELQQLGLPKENSDGISRPFRIHRDKLTAQAAADSLRLPRVCSAAVRSDVIVASSACGGLLPAGGAATAASAQTTCVYHVSLGLSHGMAGTAPRVAAQDADSTQLLQTAAARAGTGRAVSGLGLEPALALQAQAALLALNAQPLVPAAAGPLSPSESSAAASAGSSSVLARVQPAQRIAFTVSAEKAAALLSELRVARRVLASLSAASSASAAPAAGSGAGAGGAAAGGDA